MPVQVTNQNQEDYKQAIRAFLQAKPAPDVLAWSAGNRARFFIARDQIAPISDMWAANNYDDVLAPAFNRLAEYQGEKYFLPTDYYWWAIYYRPSLFEQVGISEPKTWEELLGACDALNEAGITPIAIGNRFKWPAAGWFDYLNMRVNGPEFHQQLTDLEIPLTDPRVKAVFTTWQDLFDHNCFLQDAAAYDWQEALDPMIQGQAAMYLMGDFVRESYPDELEDDLDFFQFPVINPDVPIGEDAPTDGFFMSVNAAHPEAAEAFMAYLASQDVQQQRLDEQGRLPTRTDLDLSNVDPFIQKGVEMVQSADYVALFFDRDTAPEMADIGMDAMLRFWNDPDQIDSILQDWEAERQRYLASQSE